VNPSACFLLESHNRALKPDLSSRMLNWWAHVAGLYHTHIAVPDSEKHRQIMLAGYPTWELTKFILDPGAGIDDPHGGGSIG
jgi:hypothetical protein